MNKRVKRGCRDALQMKRIICSMLSELFSIQHSINIFEYSHVPCTIPVIGDIALNKIDAEAAIMRPYFVVEYGH